MEFKKFQHYRRVFEKEKGIVYSMNLKNLRNVTLLIQLVNTQAQPERESNFMQGKDANGKWNNLSNWRE